VTIETTTETKLDVDETDVRNDAKIDAKYNDKKEIDTKFKKDDAEEKLKKAYAKFGHDNKPSYFGKKNKPFPNFPASESYDDGGFQNGGAGKHDFMLKLFFGRDPVSTLITLFSSSK